MFLTWWNRRKFPTCIWALTLPLSIAPALCNYFLFALSNKSPDVLLCTPSTHPHIYPITAGTVSTEAWNNSFTFYFWEAGIVESITWGEGILLYSLYSLSSFSFFSHFPSSSSSTITTTIPVLASSGSMWLMASGVQGSTHERGPVTHLRLPYVCLHELCASGKLPLPEDIREAAGCH